MPSRRVLMAYRRRRELTRTPPTSQTDTEMHDRSSKDQSDVNTHAHRAHGVPEPQGSCAPRARIDSTICPAVVSSGGSRSMLRGMVGYQLTQTDQEFIERMNQEKLSKQLEGELADLERSIKSEAMALDLALASKEKALEELKKYPSCEELVAIARSFLSETLPIGELDNLDHRTLLAMVDKQKVLVAISKKKKVLVAMEEQIKMKKEAEAEEKEKQGKLRILEKKHEINGLMRQLANLQSELAKETETCRSLEMKATTSLPAAKKTRRATVINEEPEQSDSLRRSKRIASKSSRSLEVKATAPQPAAKKTRKAKVVNE